MLGCGTCLHDADDGDDDHDGAEGEDASEGDFLLPSDAETGEEE